VFQRELSQIERQKLGGLSFTEIQLMGAIEAQSKATVKSIAQSLQMQASQVCRSLTRLRERLLVVASENANDGRSSNYFLTSTGKELVSTVLRPVSHLEKQLIATLSPEELAALEKGLDELLGYYERP
jgi:DNA-binding MarR family transcriptional regulator